MADKHGPACCEAEPRAFGKPRNTYLPPSTPTRSRMPHAYKETRHRIKHYIKAFASSLRRLLRLDNIHLFVCTCGRLCLRPEIFGPRYRGAVVSYTCAHARRGMVHT